MRSCMCVHAYVRACMDGLLACMGRIPDMHDMHDMRQRSGCSRPSGCTSGGTSAVRSARRRLLSNVGSSRGGVAEAAAAAALLLLACSK